MWNKKKDQISGGAIQFGSFLLNTDSALTLFKAIFDDARDGLLLAQADTRRFVMANKSICRMLGYSEEELLKLSVDDIHPAPDLPRVIDIFKAQAKGEINSAVGLPSA